jgi:hypothetical protein
MIYLLMPEGKVLGAEELGAVSFESAWLQRLA